MATKLEVGKKYVTNYGNGEPFIVVAVTEQWVICTRNNGKREFIHPISNDFVVRSVEYKEPKRGTVWLNVYPDCIVITHTTRDIADSRAGPNRIACIEVPWVEGQGI